jgi:inner membrane protein involved in colicin E2 resistance
MSRYGKCVLTGVFLMVVYGVMVWGMGMMNRPSDVSLYVGTAVILAVVMAGPLVVRGIWRR